MRDSISDISEVLLRDDYTAVVENKYVDGATLSKYNTPCVLVRNAVWGG